MGRLAHAAATANAVAAKDVAGAGNSGGKAGTAATASSTGASKGARAQNGTAPAQTQDEVDDDDDGYDGPSTSKGVRRPQPSTAGNELLAAQIAADDGGGGGSDADVALEGAGVLGAAGVAVIEQGLRRGAEKGQSVEETIAELEDNVVLEGEVEAGARTQLLHANAAPSACASCTAQTTCEAEVLRVASLTSASTSAATLGSQSRCDSDVSGQHTRVAVCRRAGAAAQEGLGRARGQPALRADDGHGRGGGGGRPRRAR